MLKKYRAFVMTLSIAVSIGLNGINVSAVEYAVDMKPFDDLRVIATVPLRTVSFTEEELDKLFVDRTGVDRDQDGLFEALEAVLGTSDFDVDSDLDGYGDSLEFYIDSDPTDHQSVPTYALLYDIVVPEAFDHIQNSDLDFGEMFKKIIIEPKFDNTLSIYKLFPELQFEELRILLDYDGREALNKKDIQFSVVFPDGSLTGDYVYTINVIPQKETNVVQDNSEVTTVKTDDHVHTINVMPKNETSIVQDNSEETLAVLNKTLNVDKSDAGVSPHANIKLDLMNSGKVTDHETLSSRVTNEKSVVIKPDELIVDQIYDVLPNTGISSSVSSSLFFVVAGISLLLRKKES